MDTEVIQDTHTIVHTTGEIDLSNIADFVKALDEAAEKAPKGFIIDLTDTTYMDSAGVHAILDAFVKMHESEGSLAVVVGNAAIRSVLRVVHLEQIPGMSVSESLDMARETLSC